MGTDDAFLSVPILRVIFLYIIGFFDGHLHREQMEQMEQMFL